MYSCNLLLEKSPNSGLIEFNYLAKFVFRLKNAEIEIGKIMWKNKLYVEIGKIMMTNKFYVEIEKRQRYKFP